MTWTNMDSSQLTSCDIHMRTKSLKMGMICIRNYSFKIITPSPRGEWVKSTTYTALGLLCGDRKLLATVHAERLPLFCYTKYKIQGILCFEWDNGSWYVDILHWYHVIMVITRLYCCIMLSFSEHIRDILGRSGFLGPLLLTWINFNPNMDM